MTKGWVGMAMAPRLDKLIGEQFTFALNLRSIREANEITQATFAATLGISPAHLCAVEKGTKR